MFQTALEFFGDEEDEVEKAQSVFAAFARMETRLKEYDRARVIYKVIACAFSVSLAYADFASLQFALSRLPRSKSANRACQCSSKH